MAIPASHIVEVLPRVITGGSSDLELNGLLLSANPLISASTLVLSFPSARAVGDYFGVGSPEHIAADVYFTSYANKLLAPKAFFVARRIAEDVSGWLRGAKFGGTLADLKAITDGSFVISIDGSAVEIDGVDLTTATSLSDVARSIQNGLDGVAPGTTATYSSLTGAFTITSGTTGDASEVGYADAAATGTDLSVLLRLRQEDGAIASEGMNALMPSEQMYAVLAKTQNFVSFTTAYAVDVEEAKLWAAWASANYGWLYVCRSTDPLMVSRDSGADHASALKAGAYDHTAVIYGGLEDASFIMGVVASIAWQRVNGTITAAFKRQSGLAPQVVDEATAVILEGKNCNYFGNFATRNAEFVFLYPGVLSASDYGFIDPYVNSIWLNNRLQVALMDGITSIGRVPYNVRGYTMIKAWMMDPVNEAKNNAAIEAGVTLSERQKSEVMNEAGLDISGELWTQGYYIQVLDPGASVRAQRGSPIISLWYTYGGAVQRIEVASTVIL